MTAKKKAWEWCSKYIRLRDAIEYQNKNPEVDLGWVNCCTCGKLIHIKKNTDAGHFIDRGSGGLSGVYFDERNIHSQCKPCNAGFYQGREKRNVKQSYEDFMLQKYGSSVVDELKFLDKNQSYKGKIGMIGEMYKQMYKELLKKQGERNDPYFKMCNM